LEKIIHRSLQKENKNYICIRKSITELNTSKVPVVIIDKRLDNLDKVVLFPKKVDKAKETLNRIGLPKESHKR